MTESTESCAVCPIYTSADAVADNIVRLGRCTLLAKMDIKQAYRVVPVHPVDCRLLGTYSMRWGGRVYIDKALPFGLRSAPLIFTAMTDALLWIMQQKGVFIVDHYFNHFTLGKPQSRECAANFRYMLEACQATGIPVEHVNITPKHLHKLQQKPSLSTFTSREIGTFLMSAA